MDVPPPPRQSSAPSPAPPPPPAARTAQGAARRTGPSVATSFGRLLVRLGEGTRPPGPLAGAVPGVVPEGTASAAARAAEIRSPGERRDEDQDGTAHEPRDLELLDSAARQAATLAPPLTSAAAPPSAQPEAPLRGRSLEELLPALVRRIAWAGDRHKGTVRLELGAGAHAGTTIVVHAEGGRLRIELSGDEGPALDGLRARLEGRLRRHGLDVESVR